MSHSPALLSRDGTTGSQLDLSRATKLKGIVFRCETLDGGWITMALETISSKHRDLEQISIHIPCVLGAVTDENFAVVERAMEEAEPGMRWSDLDRFLVQFLESHSIHMTIVYPRPEEKCGMREMEEWARCLLPELTGRGIVDVVEQFDLVL